MTKEQKRKFANLGMLLGIFVILGTGLGIVGYLRGFFGFSEGESWKAESLIGFVDVERGNISYELKKNQTCKDQDLLVTKKASGLTLCMGDAKIYLDEETEIKLQHRENVWEIYLKKGGIFVHQPQGKNYVQVNKEHYEVSNSSAYFSVETGSMHLYVLSGRVTDGENVSGTGDYFSRTESGIETAKLSGERLNLFVLQCALECCDDYSEFAFSKEEMNLLLAERTTVMQGGDTLIPIDGEENSDKASEKEDERASSKKEEQPGKQSDSNTDQTDKTTEQPGKNPDKKQDETTEVASEGDTSFSERDDSTTKKPGESTEQTTEKSSDKSTEKTTDRNPTKDTTKSESDTTKQTSETTKPTSETTREEEETSKPGDEVFVCSLTIECTNILSEMDRLKPGKDRYVPNDGYLMKNVSVQAKSGESVFDILKRACEYFDMQLEYSFSTMYNSYYVEGIGNLYEKDCGTYSGWMYSVNGWAPNYGCSAYSVKAGDQIKFYYVCYD